MCALGAHLFRHSPVAVDINHNENRFSVLLDGAINRYHAHGRWHTKWRPQHHHRPGRERQTEGGTRQAEECHFKRYLSLSLFRTGMELSEIRVSEINRVIRETSLRDRVSHTRGESQGVPCASRLPTGGCGSRCLRTGLSDVARDAQHLHVLDGALAAAIAHGELMVRMPSITGKMRRLEHTGSQRSLRTNRCRELLT